MSTPVWVWATIKLSAPFPSAQSFSTLHHLHCSPTGNAQDLWLLLPSQRPWTWHLAQKGRKGPLEKWPRWLALCPQLWINSKKMKTVEQNHLGGLHLWFAAMPKGTISTAVCLSTRKLFWVLRQFCHHEGLSLYACLCVFVHPVLYAWNALNSLSPA